MNNMRRVLCSLLLVATLLLSGASCRRRTVIPDEELALIFRDAFLVNAYVFDQNIDFDTLQVYQPIFDRYGYAVEDVAYTVGSFSKRKSARLSDVVERSIKLLEQGGKSFIHETMILDSIDAKALRLSKRNLFYKDQINFHAMRDTVDLRLEFDSLPAGSYRLSFDYLVDSLDNNRSSYRALSWGEYPGVTTRKGLATSYLRKKEIESYNRSFNSDSLIHRFVVELAESYEVKRTPHVTFRDITLEYTPPAEQAVEELFKSKLNIRIFANDFFAIQPTDSLELPPL